MPADLERLNSLLGGDLPPPFSSLDGLQLAVTHSSHGAANNQRLEYLGDAVLSAAVAELLFRQFPQANEGQLSRMRAHLVKNESLARLGKRLGLDEFIVLGRGQHNTDSIVAGTLEAVIGAMYLQLGMAWTSCYVDAWLQPLLAELPRGDSLKDAKTRLKEWCDARRLGSPQYRLLRVAVEKHVQTFFFACRVGDAEEMEGQGRSRRQAEQEAAARMLACLTQ